MMLSCGKCNDMREYMYNKLQHCLGLDSIIDTRLQNPLELSWILLGGGVVTVWSELVEDFVSCCYRVCGILTAFQMEVS
jgi:hypothetical protein